jgi:hypothetical protein
MRRAIARSGLRLRSAAAPLLSSATRCTSLDAWLHVARLPPESLRRSVVNNYSHSSKRKRINKLPYGTCQIIVSRTRLVQSIYGSIQEYAGFERPAWLE